MTQRSIPNRTSYHVFLDPHELSFPFSLQHTPTRIFLIAPAYIPSALYFEPISSESSGRALILRQLSIPLEAEEAEGFEDPTYISGLEERDELTRERRTRGDRRVEREPLGHSLRDTSEEVP